MQMDATYDSLGEGFITANSSSRNRNRSKIYTLHDPVKVPNLQYHNGMRSRTLIIKDTLAHSKQTFI